MNDDYLWDKSGEPDPEIERLETLLARYRAPRAAPAVLGRRGWKHALLIAASLVVVLGVAFAFRFYWHPNASWVVRRAGVTTYLSVGETLTTGDETALVEVARIGELEVAPHSELTLLSTDSKHHRIALRRGSLAARVWAPPFTFSIDTPAGLASDVGCAFNLRYREGGGLLHVTSGWVDFDGIDRSSLVPAGAVAELREHLGPGSPYYLDAPREFQDALRTYDAGNHDVLDRVLAAARPRDAMTLLHLIVRADPRERTMLFDRLAILAPPPAGVTREAVLRGELHPIDLWRTSLGLGGAKKWWVNWRDSL